MRVFEAGGVRVSDAIEPGTGALGLRITSEGAVIDADEVERLRDALVEWLAVVVGRKS